jgi:hypothetical protein
MLCHNAWFHSAECYILFNYYAECHYAECRYAECHYAECRRAYCLAYAFVSIQHFILV